MVFSGHHQGESILAIQTLVREAHNLYYELFSLIHIRGCVTPKQIANLKETIENDLDLLDGYEELDSESQDKIRKALADGHVDDSDWKGVSAAVMHLYGSPLICAGSRAKPSGQDWVSFPKEENKAPDRRCE